MWVNVWLTCTDCESNILQIIIIVVVVVDVVVVVVPRAKDIATFLDKDVTVCLA